MEIRRLSEKSGRGVNAGMELIKIHAGKKSWKSLLSFLK